jgi:hypothetical protein
MSWQPSTLSTLVYVLVWACVLSMPLLAWGTAAVLVPAGPGSVWRRAALPVGRAVFITLGTVLLVRVVELLHGGMQGGPLGWLRGLEQWAMGATALTWYPLDAVLALALAHALLFPVAAGVMALGERGRAPFRVPLADAAAVALLAAPLLALAVMDGPYRQDRPGRVLLDVVAVLPMLCVALAVWTRAERVAPVETPAPAEPVAPPPRVDVAALWRKVGALSAQARPLLTTSGAQGAEGPRESVTAWKDAGGTGPAPRALEEIAAAWREPGQGYLVGDLPDPTERHFLTACLTLALRRSDLPCLVIADEPETLRDAVADALARAGRWPPGSLLAGAEEVRAAFVNHRMPSAIFLGLEQLSAEGIAALGGVHDGCGRLWARTVGLVVLSRVDRGTPVDTSHRMFTLRRLGLALTSAGAHWSVLATGVGGTGTRGLVEQMFPALPVREVPFSPRAAAPVRVWRVSEPFRITPGKPWVRRALEPVVGEKLPASVGDPGGAFDRSAADFWGGEVRFVRDVSLAGAASVGELGEAWLVAAYRALPHREPLADGQPHDALWALPDTPLMRFLSRDGNLDGLARNGMLLPPRPLVGRHNGALALAHLKAALREGTQDYESLAAVFGRSRVDQVVGAAVRAERRVVRAWPGQDGLLRSPVLPPLASVADAPDPLRRTVSEQVVRIIDGHGGQVLAEVDRLQVETRFYPGRVFAGGDARYEVPLNSYDAKRSEIRVKPVPHERPLTRPQLQVQLETATVVESPQTVRSGRTVYQVATLEATVLERVSGYYQVGRPGRVDMGAVGSRYRTRVRSILFPAAVSPHVLHHLARSADGVLLAHLLASDEDIEVIPMGAGLYPEAPAGIVVVDRHLQGMGVAEALDLGLVEEMLKWVRALLANCRCPHGCPECTPQDVLDSGPDKSGVLGLLG